MRPPTTFPGGSSSPRIENPVIDLPEPDSPTRPRISPRPTSKLTPSTAFTTPCLVSKWVSRFSTARVAPLMAASPLEPRVQHLAQAVADDVDAEHQQEEQKPRIDADPVL